jgi:two-component system, NtrC family, sensor kinase
MTRRVQSRGRILVIDDQEATRYIFRRILTHAGYEVEEAQTGSEGLAKALQSPDIIISDVNLPDMLGYDVCTRLRSNPLTVSIPILQISASFISNESRVQALEGGADSYLTQPVEPTVLVAQVNALLRLRRAEALSNLSARQWQTTFDALSDGLALVDSEGAVTRANRTFMDFLNLSPSETEGQKIDELFDSRFDIPFKEFVGKEKERPSAEIPFADRWFRVRYDQIKVDPSFKSGSVLLITDITDHKKLQESLKLSERLVANGRLAHIIAHEINNPLEAMTNLLYLSLQATTENESVRSYLHQASDELSRISQITKQVLAYHRGSRQPIQTRANELLESSLAMFQTPIAERGIELTTEIRSSKKLNVHPGEIRQVFSNLVSNALDAIALGGGKLQVRCFDARDYRSQTTGVRFIFSDSGTGISDEVYPKIFEAFYTTKNSKGSGVGLWLSAEVIGKHQGNIRVRTRTKGPYRGTLFDVFLPYSPASSTPGTPA